MTNIARLTSRTTSKMSLFSKICILLNFLILSSPSVYSYIPPGQGYAPPFPKFLLLPALTSPLPPHPLRSTITHTHTQQLPERRLTSAGAMHEHRRAFRTEKDDTVAPERRPTSLAPNIEDAELNKGHTLLEAHTRPTRRRPQPDTNCTEPPPWEPDPSVASGC